MAAVVEVGELRKHYGAVAVFFTLAFPLLLLWLNGGGGNRPRAELGGRG